MEAMLGKNGVASSSEQLQLHGLENLGSIHWNLSAPALYQEAIRRNEGVVTAGGALTVATGIHTGRSPKDKFIVDTPSIHDHINWGNVNKPISEENFDSLFKKVTSYLQGRDVFVQDCFAGADPEYRLNVRVVTESAWPNLFAPVSYTHLTLPPNREV